MAQRSIAKHMTMTVPERFRILSWAEQASAADSKANIAEGLACKDRLRNPKLAIPTLSNTSEWAWAGDCGNLNPKKTLKPKPQDMNSTTSMP